MENKENNSDSEPQKYDIARLIVALLNKPRDQKDIEENSLSPTDYLKQMLLTTEERTEYLLKTGIKESLRTIFDDFDSVSFKAEPSVVVFQNFIPGNVYNVTLVIRNISNVSRHLKISRELDPMFSIEYRGTRCANLMLAPGLAYVYDVKFIPERKQDFAYRGNFISDAEHFVVPIIAIGPRPILDFPDYIEVPATAVKIWSSKCILVRNIACVTAIFTLRTDSPHFQVEPTFGTIEEEEMTQFTVKFFADKPGDYTANLFLKYESGEILRLELSCCAANCTIRIDRGSVRMEDTYLGLSRSKIITIHNRSDHLVHYQWMSLKDNEEETRLRKRYEMIYDLVYQTESARFVDLVHYNVCIPEVHELVYRRIYADEIESLKKETFRYNHMCFDLSPEAGEIWPRSSMDVTVFFRALEIGEISSVAYLEVSGRDERLLLSICGIGKGPVLRFNVATIDVDQIYLHSVHTYEIVAANKGCIDGTLIYKSRRTSFGGTIRIEPHSLALKPGQYSSFTLTFSSNRKGKFTERVDFVIKESLEIISFHIKGCIVCPTLHFDKKSLDFDVTPLGFSSRQDANLHNLSLMPVTFTITVLNDGNEPPLTYEEFARAHTKPSFPINPREFTVSPNEGVVFARSYLKIRVIFTPNIIHNGRTFIRVDMWDSNSDPVILPISFSSRVATLSINPDEISIRFCFVNLAYTRSFAVENNSDLDGYFYLVPQLISNSGSTIFYSMSIYQGLIKARQSKTINMTIITKGLGVQTTSIDMLTMGEKSPIKACIVTCNGQGPVISLQPARLNFGEVQVLEQKIMKLLVISDSPIQAQFRMSMESKNSPFTVTPDFGELEPNETMEIEVKVYLRDAGKYTDNIIVNVVNSRSMFANLKVTGIGHSIVFEPEIFPVFDMGLLLSHQKISIPIVMTNLGTRHYQLIWSNEPELRSYRGKPMSSTIVKFQVYPSIVEIQAGTACRIYCKIRWDINETVLEDWYLFGQVCGQGKRELFGSSTFKVTLIEPQIVFDKRELELHIDMDSDEANQCHATDKISVTNKSCLNLNVQLTIDAPFYLTNYAGEAVQKKKIVLFDQATTNISVIFSPKIQEDSFYSHSFRGALCFEYDEHPNKDIIKCKGFLNYPNIAFSSKEVTLNCALGSSAQHVLILTNNGQLSATYKFIWIDDSIKIEYNRQNAQENDFIGLEKGEYLRDIFGINESVSKVWQGQVVANELGSGDGPSKLTESLRNSSASGQLKMLKFNRGEGEEVKNESFEEKFLNQETEKQEIKYLLLNVVDAYITQDMEIPILDVIGTESRTIEPINKVLDIIPHEGTILPFSSQHLYFSFHGLEAIKIEAVAACSIVRGPTQLINIFACADSIKFSVDKQVINLDQQLFCEICRANFTLKNLSSVPFDYATDDRNFDVHGASIDCVQTNLLTIEPCKGTVNPKSSIELTAIYRPSYLGPFDVKFRLKVAHLTPIAMRLTGVGIYPQVYFEVPQVPYHLSHSVELGYRAVQSLCMEFVAKDKYEEENVEKMEQEEENNQIGNESIESFSEAVQYDADCEFTKYNTPNDDWVIISHKNNVPTTIDILMAIERTIASDFLKENLEVLTKHSEILKKHSISCLRSLEYIVDLGCIVVGLTAHYSAILTNYGPVIADVKLKKPDDKELLSKFDIIVQFKRESNFLVGNSTLLHVICSPTYAKYKSRKTEIKHTIYLEVVHGCSIPVIITGIVTYPHLTINKNHLEFHDVIVGECLMMCLLFKNEGLIDCYWETRFSCDRKRAEEECPFSLHHDHGVYSPGHSGVINVYFKPRRSGFVETKLIVIVKMSREIHKINLTGNGIEQSLNIVEPTIEFSPIVPYTELQERTFMIENSCVYPIEVFWHHIDNWYLQEDRVTKALTHYYRVKEILLPPRKLGERLPSLLLEFYNGLIADMIKTLSVEFATDEKSKNTWNFGEEKRRAEIDEATRLETLRKTVVGRKRKSSTSKVSLRLRSSSPTKLNRRRSSTHETKEAKRKRLSDESMESMKTTKNDCPSASLIVDVDETHFDKNSPLQMNDPDELQRFLHRYIDEFHAETEFQENMKDPVKELFDQREQLRSIESKSVLDFAQPARKVCIIFHGAPFTEYQETACRSARVLGIPVLCLDKVILDVIAFSDSVCAVELRRIIDETFSECTMQFRIRSSTETTMTRRFTDTESTDRDTATTKSPKHAKGRIKKNADASAKHPNDDALIIQQEKILHLPKESDPILEYSKISDIEGCVETMDLFSRYEFKIRTIRLLEKILPPHLSVGSAKDKLTIKKDERSARRQKAAVFLHIDAELFSRALEERLSMPDFKSGFVLQTLRNIYIDDDITTLLALLRAIGHVEYSLFVTFWNDMNAYECKIEQLRRAKAEEKIRHDAEKIKYIDEMSLSEYETLQDEERDAYLSAILPARKEDALLRRRLSRNREDEPKEPSLDLGKEKKNRRRARTSRSKLTIVSDQDGKSSKKTSIKKSSSQKKAKSRDSSKSTDKEKMPKELAEVASAMDNYSANLSNILKVINNWDPIKKIVDETPSWRSRLSKTATSKVTSAENTREEILGDVFHIWYVRESDPWKKMMCDVIVSRMKENDLAKSVLPVEVLAEPNLEPQMYSILSPIGFDICPDATQNNEYAQIRSGVYEIHSTNAQQDRADDNETKFVNATTMTTEERDEVSSILETTRIENLEPRWILQPRETQTYKIRYRPKDVGIHEETYSLTIVDGPGTTYRIKVKGISDIPRLDTTPHVLYPKVEDEKQSETNGPAYFLNTKTFDFGPLVLLRKDKRPHRREVQFEFHNISTIDAETSFRLLEDNPATFHIRPERLVIKAGNRDVLYVSAGVTKLGPVHNMILVCIKNNPCIETLQLCCHGTKLDVELDKKQLSFGRVLLHRREIRVSTIRNKSTVPIAWRVEAEEPVEPQITFEPSKGIIEPLGEQLIEFCYNAVRLGAIARSTMIFKVYLTEDYDESIFNDVISAAGETYDVAVSIDHANPIDLKCVRVGFPVDACFVMKNIGNYEIKYIVTLEDDEVLSRVWLKCVPASRDPQKDLDVSPASGLLQPQKSTTIQIRFLPKNEISLTELPILRCRLLDTNKRTTVVAEFPLTVSLNAYYTRFRLEPYPYVDFGSLGICTQKTMYLNVINTGRFSLDYVIGLPPDGHTSVLYMSNVRLIESIRKGGADQSEASNKKEKKFSKSDKLSLKQVESTATVRTLNVGPFVVTKIEGTVKAGETDSIAIECSPEFVGSQEEQFLFTVDDSLPETRDGKKITLLVDSRVPSIDFSDLETMFHGNHIVNDLEDLERLGKIDGHAVFVSSKKLLFFRRVGVTKSYAACFKLCNRNVVPADVVIEILMDASSRNVTVPFSVEPREIQIPMESRKIFTLTFTPSLIQMYRGTLVIRVRLPAQLEDEKQFIELMGETCVPEVSIVEPSSQATRGRVLVGFGRNLVNETLDRTITFKNIGLIRAKVILQIDEDPTYSFVLAACDDTRRFLRTSECIDDDENDADNDDANASDDRGAIVSLVPENTARFCIKFRPKEVGRYLGQVRLYIVDNPYENPMVELEGEGFLEAIVLDGLELTDPISNATTTGFDRKGRRNVPGYTDITSISTSLREKERERERERGRETSTTFLTYKLDYGFCYVNKMYKKTFAVVNKTSDRCFRFEWPAHPNLVFQPTVGHLRYLTSKHVTATLLESEPIHRVDMPVQCVIYEIVVDDSLGRVSWDDRQTIVRWDEEDTDDRTEDELLAKKIIEPTVEPEHRVLPGTTKHIQVFLNVNVQFSRYSCSVNEINFKDTLMFQKREYTFSLTNPGSISVVYRWKVDMDEEYPKRISENTPRISKSRLQEIQSRLDSRASGSVLYPANYDYDDNLKLHRCKPLSSYDEAIEIKPRGCSCRPSDLYSSTAYLTERSSDSWMESEDLPFTILPESGTLPPSESVECTLRFFPMDVFEYKAYLICKMENLDPKQDELTVTVTAKSILPYCHFDIPESDYLSNCRRDPNLPSPVDYKLSNAVLKNTKVIELKVIGIGGTHTKRFRMINPTADNYRFTWEDYTFRNIDEISNFHCAVSEGIAERGKQTNMTFTFLATDVGIFESYWLFSIKRYNLECLFLFVGIVVEPSVHHDTTHLRMKPTVLGVDVRDTATMINDEDFPIPFHIVQDSLYSEGRFQSIRVSPMSGVLKAKSTQILRITYKPTQVGEFQFSMQCAMKLMKKPLIILVTTKAYSIVPSVSYVTADNSVVQLHHDRENVIDFGKIIPKKASILGFEIANPGKVTFHYVWDLGMTPDILARDVYALTMSQKQGHVTSDSRTTCHLSLTPKQKTMIRNHLVALKISRGPTYRLMLKATAKKPSVEFSFRLHDFGCCYIQETNTSPYRMELRLTNSENRSFVLECKYQDQPHLSVNLDRISKALAGHSSVVVPIVFRPLEQTHYRESLIFVIDSSIEEKITIIGEGIPYKVRLVTPRDKSIDLGNPRIGETVVKRVPLINEGRAPVVMCCDLLNNLPNNLRIKQRILPCIESNLEDQKILARASISETKRSGTDDPHLFTSDRNIYNFLAITTSSNAIGPGSKTDVLVKFQPLTRTKPFVQKVGIQLDSTKILPLFVLRGSCVAPEFRLSRAHLSFGGVVRGCASTANLALFNTGDIGSRFEWDTSDLPDDFKISPLLGYSCSGMDITFTVEFRPTRESNFIEGNARLNVEQFGVLSTKIAGCCRELPAPKATLYFKTSVRGKRTEYAVVENDSNVPWKLKAEVTGDYFRADQILSVPPNESGYCAIVYEPLRMNTEDTPHEGTLLLKPPEREPILFILRGLSLPPQVLAKIDRRLPAKMKYTELLTVYNWTNRQQRFACEIKSIEEDSKTIAYNSTVVPMFKFTGNSKIDVPANGQRDYPAVFHSYKEFLFRFRVTFTNSDNEYQFYEIQYDVTQPEVIKSIKLYTNVRTPICHSLTLSNPLKDTTISYTAYCQHPDVIVYDLPKIVQPSWNENVDINYSPVVKSAEVVVKLVISCEELGDFPYELRLKAEAAPPEKVTRVAAALGDDATFSLVIRNRTSKKAEFKIEVDNDSITCPAKLEISEYGQGLLDAIYEPHSIENITATLTATSDVAGDFAFPIIGTYHLPKPHGPYTLTPRAPATIRFKNVFKGMKTFEFILDNTEAFETKKSSINVQEKQIINIAVNLRKYTTSSNELAENKYPQTGKLSVYCNDPKLSNVTWIYYLRGIYD